jgi:Pyridine nucleotide-disulphide oxidoreductase
MTVPVVVIGAGPHGLAATAHLREAAIPAVTFGKTLEFWRETMPSGMLLRSPKRATSISSPREELSLTRWGELQGREIADNMPIAHFLEYGSWFQSQAVPELDGRMVTRVARHNGGFAVTLSDQETLAAGRVVVATGLAPFANIPAPFRELVGSLVSHASASPALNVFAGKSVAVIGSGQSALETAALLSEANAGQVELIARAGRIYWLNHGWLGARDASILPPPAGPPCAPSWRARNGLYWHGAPTDVGGRLSSWAGAAPDVIRHLPRRMRAPLTYHCIRPAGADWLPDRMRAVRFTLGRAVASAKRRDGRVQLSLDDGGERSVDHVVLGTGYAIDVRRYPFLDAELLEGLRLVQGSPVLGRGLESSVPGLHFLGATAAESFGPTMRFVVGTAYAAPALTQRLLGRRRPLFRWAF